MEHVIVPYSQKGCEIVMSLFEYRSKEVIVTLIDGSKIAGFCSGHTFAVNNEPAINSISLDADNALFELFENEIASIEILHNIRKTAIM